MPRASKAKKPTRRAASVRRLLEIIEQSWHAIVHHRPLPPDEISAWNSMLGHGRG